MKIFTLFAVLIVLTSCQTVEDFYGSGPVTLSTSLENHFKTKYLPGPGPAFYVIPVDGTSAYHSFCPAGAGMCQFDVAGLNAITDCERDTGQKCYVFAEGDQIVWKGPVKFQDGTSIAKAWKEFKSNNLSSSGTADTRDAAVVLRDLISERLALMPSVAKFKWNRNIAVEDLAREKVILDGLVDKAEQAGVSSAFADQFFKDQIAAAKAIQWNLMRTWRNDDRGNFNDVPNLKTTVRPALDQLTIRILSKLSILQAGTVDPEAIALFDVPPPRWTSQPDIWHQAIRSLKTLYLE